MPRELLRLPTILTSWLLGASAWVLLWWFLPTVQGLTTAAAGGQFIGLALPTWTQPWALVNEPTVGFAATSSALWAYWLSPFLAAALVAVALPHLSSGGSLTRHLLFNHLAFASSCLGLGWLPSLGLEDGLLAGLARFFHQDPNLWRWGLALLGAVLVWPVVQSVGSLLWDFPGGPTVRRKLLAWGCHLGVPAGAWVGSVATTAPGFPGKSLAPWALVVGLSFVWALVGTPRHPLGEREFHKGTAILTLGFALLVVVPSLFVFSPAGSRPKGYLWGVETVTSNVRREIFKVTLPLSPAARRGSSGPRS